MTQKRHILFIAGWYPSRVTPDSGDFIQRHAQALASVHKVSVIHVKSDKKATQKFELVVKDEGTYISRIAYIKPSSLNFIKIFQFISAYKKLIQQVGDYDLVHINKLFPAGLVGLYLKVFKKKAYLVSEHFHGYFAPYHKNISFIQKTLSKLITKQAAFVCPVSKSLGKAMQDLGLQGRYSAVPNVINTELFKPAKNKSNTFNIVHVSSMSPIKNVPVILRSIARFQEEVPDFHFYLIGRNALQFKALTTQLAIDKNKISYIDQLPQEALVPYYQQADVVVLFSEMETFSIVTYEAIACGTPVITTKVGGIMDYFPKEYGFLIDHADEKALLNSLLNVYSKAQNWDIKAMHQYVSNHFSKENITEKFSELYDKMKNSDK